MNKRLAVAVFAYFPLVAVFHHAVFFPTQCLLNPLGLPDYSARAAMLLVEREPAIYVAAGLSIALYVFLTKFPQWTMTAFICIVAFLPVALWVLDVPFTTRMICAHWHDNQSVVKGRHLYELAILLCAIEIIPKVVCSRSRSSSPRFSSSRSSPSQP